MSILVDKNTRVVIDENRGLGPTAQRLDAESAGPREQIEHLQIAQRSPTLEHREHGLLHPIGGRADHGASGGTKAPSPRTSCNNTHGGMEIWLQYGPALYSGSAPLVANACPA